MDRLMTNNMNVSILVDGRRLPIYLHDGSYWIAGEPGKAYRILVECLFPGRKEVLESVDGRNVLRDEPASFRNQGMVVTGVWENSGWRLNDNQVREFVFGDPGASIAAQATGSVDNVGVIGVAVFNEKQRFSYGIGEWAPRSGGTGTWRMDDGSTLRDTGARITSSDASWSVSSKAGGQSLSAAPADLGTGMGDLRDDAVGHTTFVRATETPAVAIEIQYRTRQWLLNNGIITPALPSAFPDNGSTGYARYAK